jgi:hypothetical protein
MFNFSLRCFLDILFTPNELATSTYILYDFVRGVALVRHFSHLEHGNDVVYVGV